MRKAIMIVLAASFALLLFFFPSRKCAAQAALNASPEDPVYHAIDLFIADGLVPDVIMGQGPFSRLEVARILRTARKTLDERTKAADAAEAAGDEGTGWKSFSRSLSKRYYYERLLDYYEHEYARELAGMRPGIEFDALKQLDIDSIYNSSDPRAIPPSNGEDSINGIVTSFDKYDQGKTYVDGGNIYLTTETDLYLSRYFAFTVQPRFEFLSDVNSDTQVNARIDRLYLKGGISNFEVQVGRDNIYWGQGEYGGLMLSTNPRGLDMLKISNPYPLRIPYVGHMKFTLFVSNLGPDQSWSYPYFYGLKWTWKPIRCFEFGLSHTVITGGEGAPKLSFWDPLTEMFPFQKWGRNSQYGDIANNAFGFLDMRLTIPPLRNSIIYYDGYFEDSIARAFGHLGNLLNQMGFIAGWYTPRLTDRGDVGLRLEYHHTAPLQYRHGDWISGYTENQRVIGDALGPDADGIYATTYWRPTARMQARLDLAYEDYDSSTYYTQTDADGGGGNIVKLTYGPHEHRYRAVGGIRWDVKSRYGLRFSAGYERIDNWNFQVGRSVNNALLEAGITLRFDEFNVSTR